MITCLAEFPPKKHLPQWFKVSFLSLSWRSLNLSKRSLNHPKKVTLNHQVVNFANQNPNLCSRRPSYRNLCREPLIIIRPVSLKRSHEFELPMENPWLNGIIHRFSYEFTIKHQLKMQGNIPSKWNFPIKSVSFQEINGTSFQGLFFPSAEALNRIPLSFWHGFWGGGSHETLRFSW